MLKFDFKSYTKDWINEEEYLKKYQEKDKYIEMLHRSDMTGWIKEIDLELVSSIKSKASYIRDNYDCLVVVGIGGSYLGNYAFHNLFKDYFDDSSFPIYYVGYSLSSKYINDLIKHLENKKFCLDVISKSGNTKETIITYNIFKDVLKRKHGSDYYKHIIMTTNEDGGFLREEAKKNNFDSLPLFDNIGGRYSFISAAHLLPLALNFDVQKIIDGYYDGKRYIDEAFSYALTRELLFKSGKVVENFCVWEENMAPFCEWLKQLFGETEGKDSKGILPISVVYSRDLHSLGQFIQDGNKILFETFITIEDSNNYLAYENGNLKDIENVMIDSVIKAHYLGHTPILEIKVSDLSLESIGELIYFSQLSAAFSAYLIGVEPFDQPGVEVYKTEMQKELEG